MDAQSSSSGTRWPPKVKRETWKVGKGTKVLSFHYRNFTYEDSRDCPTSSRLFPHPSFVVGRSSNPGDPTELTDLAEEDQAPDELPDEGGPLGLLCGRQGVAPLRYTHTRAPDVVSEEVAEPGAVRGLSVGEVAPWRRPVRDPYV